MLWPDSWVAEAHHTDTMETTITILTLWSNRAAGYVLAGVDALAPGGSGHFALEDVTYDSGSLAMVEGGNSSACLDVCHVALAAFFESATAEGSNQTRLSGIYFVRP